MNAPESYPLEILLFDMDGVLLVPAGYHLALQETVATIGRALGFSKAHLGTETIAQFEAAGATSEWDSSAICAVLLLIRLWERYPHGRLTARSLSDPHTPHDLPAPDFHAFARSLAETGPVHTPPLPRAETLLIDHAPDWSPTQIAHLRELLQGAREIDRSITHRMFQEFVLGSELFNQIYGLSPLFSLAGYLETCDQPALDLQTVKLFKRLVGLFLSTCGDLYKPPNPRTRRSGRYAGRRIGTGDDRSPKHPANRVGSAILA